MNKTFNEGDKIYYEFTPHTVTRIENGEVTQVTDDCIHRSGLSLTDGCFHITDDIIKISHAFIGFEEVIRNAAKEPFSLNWPQIQNKLVEYWEAACNAANGVDSYFVVYYVERADHFTAELVARINEIRNMTIEEIYIMRG